MRRLLAVPLLAAVACTSGTPDATPSPSRTGASPGTREWANERCADAWYVQGIVPKDDPHTVEGYPTTVGKLVPWNESGRGGNYGHQPLRPTAPPDALAAVCVYTGDFGEAEGKRPPSPTASPPHLRSLMLFVYEDGAPLSGVSLTTTERQFETPPPTPG